MSYKFINQVPPETLDHVFEFKNDIDLLLLQSKYVITVGWRPDGGYGLYEALRGTNTYLVEVFENHVLEFKYPGIKKIHADIRNYKNFIPESHRDCLVWLDGPNNVEMQEVRGLFMEMQKEFNTIIIATPNGYKEHGSYMGNVNEVNLSHWYPKDYDDLGFTYTTCFDETGLIGYWSRPEKIVYTDSSPTDELIESGNDHNRIIRTPVEFNPTPVPEPEPVINTDPVRVIVNMALAKKLELPTVTCICADTTYYKGTMDSLWWNFCQVKFAKIILLTDERIYDSFKVDYGYYNANIPKLKAMGVELVMIPPIMGKMGVGSYSHIFMKKIHKYIETEHFLIVQQDGWVCNINEWTDEFLEYDYIGSPWHFYDDDMKVGNGGFSLRSTRLHAILAADPDVDGTFGAEDHQIARYYRPMLEQKYGIRYPSTELATRFAYDGPQPPGQPPDPLPFGFHQVNTKGWELDFANIYGYF